MAADDVEDPGTAPPWALPGVSGTPRGRDWDAVASVDLPELQGSPLAEIVFLRLGDGTVEGFADDVPRASVERLAKALEEILEPPYEAYASRRGTRDWTVGARAVRLELATLPAGLEATEVMLAVGPDGSRTLLVDGEDWSGSTPEMDGAVRELERLGRARADAFVARAQRVGPSRWAVSVDPL